MMWCMKRTNIYLAEGQAAALDRAAQAAGVSRAELIRELIDRAIGGPPSTGPSASWPGRTHSPEGGMSAWITWTGWPARDPS